QADSGDSPTPVKRSAGRGSNLRGMIEMLIESFEESPVRHTKLLDAAVGIAVAAEQDAVLILEEELADHDRRPSQVLNGGGEFDVRIGKPVQQRGNLVHVVVQHGKVCVHKARIGVFGVHIFTRLFDYV